MQNSKLSIFLKFEFFKCKKNQVLVFFCNIVHEFVFFFATLKNQLFKNWIFIFYVEKFMLFF